MGWGFGLGVRVRVRHVRTVWAAFGVGRAGAAEGGGDPRLVRVRVT